MAILAVNAGSSSLKFSLHPLEGGQVLPHSLSGNVQGLEPGGTPEMGWSFQGQKHTETLAVPAGAAPFTVALERLRRLVQELAAAQGIQAVAHRVVHGGGEYTASVRVTDEVLERLTRFNSLAPLHQPHNLEGIRRFRAAFPEVAQVACFDTAFHAHMPEVDYAFALPKELRDQGVRRYGFHGLSYAAIARKLPGVLGAEEAEKRVVVMHLGSGSSACAIHRRQSVASSMGFSAVDGLMMGTRPGNLDPEVILYWIEHEQMSLADIRAEIYKQGGLLGVSGGLSSDMRELIDNPHPHAQEAVALFCYRAAREIGALAVQLGGIDHLVFTAGIGERSARVRARIVERLAWLGLKLDQEANQQDEACISTPDSSRGVWVIRTDEEGEMARQTRHLLQQNPAG